VGTKLASLESELCGDPAKDEATLQAKKKKSLYLLALLVHCTKKKVQMLAVLVQMYTKSANTDTWGGYAPGKNKKIALLACFTSILYKKCKH
jgi:hypothetical protein